MQKYKETGNENTAISYSAILRLYGKRTIFYAYVKKLLVKHNLISFFRCLSPRSYNGNTWSAKTYIKK